MWVGKKNCYYLFAEGLYQGLTSEGRSAAVKIGDAYEFMSVPANTSSDEPPTS